MYDLKLKGFESFKASNPDYEKRQAEVAAQMGKPYVFEDWLSNESRELKMDQIPTPEMGDRSGVGWPPPPGFVYARSSKPSWGGAPSNDTQDSGWANIFFKAS